MIKPENGPAAERKTMPKRAKRKPDENSLNMDAPGPTQHSSVADNPSGISREASQNKKPITNQDEQEVITNQEQSSLDPEKT